jgi:hypothetical protein
VLRMTIASSARFRLANFMTDQSVIYISRRAAAASPAEYLCDNMTDQSVR